MTAGSRSLLDLYQQLLQSWSTETGRHWQPENQASGQCGVTALIVQDKYGGEILKTDVNGAWHFYNQIEGNRVDFTMSQFNSPIVYQDLSSNRNEALNDCSPEQYNRLRQKIMPAT